MTTMRYLLFVVISQKYYNRTCLTRSKSIIRYYYNCQYETYVEHDWSIHSYRMYKRMTLQVYRFIIIDYLAMFGVYCTPTTMHVIFAYADHLNLHLALVFETMTCHCPTSYSLCAINEVTHMYAFLHSNNIPNICYTQQCATLLCHKNCV